MKLLKQVDAENFITLEGWKPYKDLPALYANATCFVLPSSFEPWGLVVNEAMAAGLPVIVSEEVGCQPDLVGKQNGWVFKAQKEEELVIVLNELGQKEPEEIEEMGKASLAKIQNLGLDFWCSQLIKAFSINKEKSSA